MLGIEYQLKPSGHRHALLESSGRRTDWQFDAHYRLTQETISSDTAGPNGSAAYTYDAVGNRQTRTSTLGLLSNQSLSYNSNDWLATDTYDSSGNTTASEGNADTYDFLNRLIRRITPTHALLDYEYNAEGILIAKTKNGHREEYHIDGNNPTGYAQVVETFFDTGTALQLQAVHHYGHDLVSVYQNNGSTWQRHFYLYDGLGSVRALANEDATLTDTYTYDAFGTLLHSTGSTANPYRYTGERYDADLGMYYLRARYMNTETGRFWTMDSYEGRNSDPITLHKYLYANANPVMYVDPSGMFSNSSEISIATSVQTNLAISLTISLMPFIGVNSGEVKPSIIIDPIFNKKLKKLQEKCGNGGCVEFAKVAQPILEEKGLKRNNGDWSIIQYNSYPNKTYKDFIYALIGLYANTTISSNGHHEGIYIKKLGLIIDNNVLFVTKSVWINSYLVVGMLTYNEMTIMEADMTGYGEIKEK